MKSERQYDYNNGVATIRSERAWDRNQSRVVDLVQFANGSQGLDASIDANGGGQYLAPGYRYHIIVEKDTKDVTKATSQTVKKTQQLIQQLGLKRLILMEQLRLQLLLVTMLIKL